MTEPPPAYTSNSVAKSAAIYNSKQLLIWRTNSRVDRNVAAKAVSHATAVQPSVPTPTVTCTLSGQLAPRPLMYTYLSGQLILNQAIGNYLLGAPGATQDQHPLILPDLETEL